MPAPQHAYRLYSAALFCLIGALAACGNKSSSPPPPPPQQVVVVTLQTQPVPLKRELPGRTSAFLVAEVRPQVSGIVKRRLFTEGGQVTAGQVLYELDDAVYRATYNSAQANLNKAQAALEVARLAAARSAELVKIDAVSTQDNENAVATLRQAEADVGANQATLQSARVNLDYAHITAPISGRIGKSSVTAGALVTANQTTALATLQQLDPLYIDVAQSSSEWLELKQEIDAGRMQSGGHGTAAQVVLENGRNYPHDGKLQFSDVTVDETTGSFLLRVLVPNPQGTLMPGMYVKAIVNEGILSSGVLAPQQGITRSPKGDATALVVEQDGKVASRDIKVSRTIGDQWLVTDGLTAGDRVIVEGLQKIHPGMPVQAVERAATPASPATQLSRSQAPAAGK